MDKCNHAMFEDTDTSENKFCHWQNEQEEIVDRITNEREFPIVGYMIKDKEKGILTLQLFPKKQVSDTKHPYDKYYEQFMKLKTGDLMKLYYTSKKHGCTSSFKIDAYDKFVSDSSTDGKYYTRENDDLSYYKGWLTDNNGIDNYAFFTFQVDLSKVLWEFSCKIRISSESTEDKILLDAIILNNGEEEEKEWKMPYSTPLSYRQ